MSKKQWLNPEMKNLGIQETKFDEKGVCELDTDTLNSLNNWQECKFLCKKCNKCSKNNIPGGHSYPCAQACTCSHSS